MAVLFIVIGVGVVGLGVKFWFDSQRFLARAVRTSGLVVDMKRSWSRTGTGGSSTIYYPIFRFTGPDGQGIVQKSRAGSSHPSLRPGDAVTVLYDPQKPSDARIDSVQTRGPMASVMAMVFGAVFALVGVGMATGVLH